MSPAKSSLAGTSASTSDHSNLGRDKSTPAAGGPDPKPSYIRVFGLGRGDLVQWLTLIVFAGLALAPILPTIYQSLVDQPLYVAGQAFILDNYGALFAEAGFGRVLANTAMFAVLTTILALALAVPTAIVIERTDIPGSRLFAVLMQWPFFISSLILGFGWIAMYGPAGFISTGYAQLFGQAPWTLYSLGGMAVTEAVALMPIVYTFCANALRNSDSSLEAAFQTCGGRPLRVILRVVVPMLRPPIVYSSILVFSMSIETLSIPLLYGQPVGIDVFSTFLYKNGLQSVNTDYGILGAASTIMLTVTIALVFLQAKVLRNAKRFISVRGKAVRPRRLSLAGLKWPAVAIIALYVVFGALIPLLGLIFRSFTLIFTPLKSPFDFLTLENYERIWQFSAYANSIYNSVAIAVVGAVVVTAASVVGALVARRSTFRFARIVEYAALIPQAIPGIIIGLGFFWAFAVLPFGLGALFQGSVLGLLLAFGVRALPSAFASVAPSLMQIGPELDDAARVCGADWATTFTRIMRRLLTPAAGASMLLVFVAMMKEYSAAIFLASPNTQVMGTTMLTLWTQGQTGSVAAIATIQIAITAGFVGIVGFFMKGYKRA